MTTEAATAIAASAGVSLVAGSVLGLSVAALAAGFFGGLVSLSVMPGVQGIFARIASVAASTVTAAFAAPYAAALFHQQSMETILELQFAAFVLGVGTQSLLPEGIASLRRRLKQLGGGPAK